MYKPRFPLITALWVCLTIAMIAQTIMVDLSQMQKRLTDNTHYVYSSVYEKTYINEVLLQNFTALVSANTPDQEAIHSFANDMRKRYPHIVRLQIQQQAGSEKNAGVTPTSKDTQASADKVALPIIFVDPLNADTRYLLGDDLLTDKQFIDTLNIARRYPQPVASPPFALDNGNHAYALFLAFYGRNIAPSEKNLCIASMIIDVSSLLPNASFLNQGAEVVLSSEHGVFLDRRASPDTSLIAANWLPSLTESRTIKRFGQSFILQATQQIGLQNLNLGLLIAILCSAAGSYFLLVAYLSQKASIQREHQQIYEKLRIERQQLEERIQGRTQELRDQLIENRRLTHQVLAIQEKERRNLSRELHDELGQSLTAIRTDAKILKRLHPEESSIVHQTSESIDAIAQHIYDVTYGLMRTLRPSALDDLGLTDALQECIATCRFEEQNITLHSNFQGALNEMTEDYNITLYRLTQEAFSNIIKYAEADNAWIDLHRTQEGQRKGISGDRIELIISDDGKGFDLKEQASKNGFGLIGMRERIRALGGVFQVQRNHDRGTRIVAIIPLAPAPSTTNAAVPKPGQAVPAEPER